ncbi:MAG: YtxH domain-containing protein [Gemmatimonadota bacterium]
MRDRDEVPYIVVEKEGSGIGSFLVGALLGAGVALLFAPRSGEETQQEIKDRAVRLKGAAEERMREVQTQLEERLDQARADVMERVDSIREAVESGREAAGEARHELGDRIERSKAAYRAGIDAARDAAREEEEEA